MFLRTVACLRFSWPSWPGHAGLHEGLSPEADSMSKKRLPEPVPTVNWNGILFFRSARQHKRTGRSSGDSSRDQTGKRAVLSQFLQAPRQADVCGTTRAARQLAVRERIEYEFYQFLEDQGESIILAKRTGRCFPPAERQLAEAGLPDDLKYMLLVESKCISAAYSRAKASGPWQFMPSTGRRYRLKSDAVRDERRNLEMSTEAAVKYLKYLKDFQQNDWFMAMASYNAGEERVRKLLKEQKITDYWKMHGPRETMRYVPRIIAAKEIYSQPEKYLGLSKKDLYIPLETETITVSVKEPQRALTSIAEEFGTYFLELKLLNPEFKKDFLPHGTYQIRVPRQTCPARCFKQEKSP